MRDRTWSGTQWAAFGGDFGLLLVATMISMRTRKYWPLVAAAFALICVTVHVGRMIDPGVHAWAYATAQVIFTQLLVLTIGVGSWNAWRDGHQPAIAEGNPTGATRR